MNILGGKHFNAGLRGMFFSIGYLGWFVSPAGLALSTLLLVIVLVRRQFFSAARDAPARSARLFAVRERPIDPARQPIADKADPFAHRHRRVLQRVGGVVAEQADPFRRPRCGSRPATGSPGSRPCGTARPNAACGRPEVTSSQVSPGFGATSSLENSAFSAVLRDLFSRIRRSRGMPNAAKKRRRRLGIALAFQHHRADAAGDQRSWLRESGAPARPSRRNGRRRCSVRSRRAPG